MLLSFTIEKCSWLWYDFITEKVYTVSVINTIYYYDIYIDSINDDAAKYNMICNICGSDNDDVL